MIAAIAPKSPYDDYQLPCCLLFLMRIKGRCAIFFIDTLSTNIWGKLFRTPSARSCGNFPSTHSGG